VSDYSSDDCEQAHGFRYSLRKGRNCIKFGRGLQLRIALMSVSHDIC